ncbi:MAG: hypothetical protein M3342_19605, partial [Bacteroidota bacterium]|nr:hypothetical protein [Bacteroidota bacterium]
MQLKLRYLLLPFLTMAFSCLTAFAQGQTTTPTVYTDKADYLPGETVIIEGDGWKAGEQVKLEIDHSTVTHGNTVLNATADDKGHIYNNEFVIQPQHLHESFNLTATGLSSGLTAQTTFTDATVTISADRNWTDQPIGENDDVVVINGKTLTINVSNAKCASIRLGTGTSSPNLGNGTLKFNANSQLTCTSDVTIGGSSYKGSLDMSLGGILIIGGSFTAPNLNTFSAGTGTIEYNGSGSQSILEGISYN